MVVQEGLAQPAGAPIVEAPGSPDWWHSRSSEELRTILQRGIQGGETFFAAAAELERRAKEADDALRAEEVHVIEDDGQRRKLAWVGLIVLPVALALAGRLFGLW